MPSLFLVKVKFVITTLIKILWDLHMHIYETEREGAVKNKMKPRYLSTEGET